MITTVTGKNQVTIPAAIANRANLRPGTRLEWRLGKEDGTLMVRVIADPATLATRLRGEGRRYRDHETHAVRNLVHERADEDPGRPD